jgi:hypothetical protein
MLVLAAPLAASVMATALLVEPVKHLLLVALSRGNAFLRV